MNGSQIFVTGGSEPEEALTSEAVTTPGRAVTWIQWDEGYHSRNEDEE